MISLAIGSTGEFNNIRNPFVPSFYGRDEVTTMLLGLMYQNDQGWEGYVADTVSIDDMYEGFDISDDIDLERERIREYLYRC